VKFQGNFSTKETNRLHVVAKKKNRGNRKRARVERIAMELGRLLKAKERIVRGNVTTWEDTLNWVPDNVTEEEVALLNEWA
jgi:hypothetical protein